MFCVDLRKNVLLEGAQKQYTERRRQWNREEVSKDDERIDIQRDKQRERERERKRAKERYV